MSEFLDHLNPQQRRATEWNEGPLLILAGAGSGKTRVITYRIAHLIRNCGVPGSAILAVTFTNKAADQMKERVAALLSNSFADSGPHLSTFHSFCVSVLRREIERLGYRREFSIYDDEDQQRLVKACTKELGLTEEMLPPRMALSRISHAKNSGVTPQEMFQNATDGITEKLASVYDRYGRRLREANALDFDDLLLKTVELFDKAPDVCEKFNRRFRYLMVDEYQDTNRVQYLLIRQLTRDHQNICVVGDEDQSIYRWRGADIRNILNFKEDFPRAEIIRLEQNYRSTQIILDAATAVVSNNRARIGKTLWSQETGGSRIGLYLAQDADGEAEYIAQEAAAALGAGPDSTVGVLYRTNAQSRLLEEAFRRHAIPHQVVGGFRFYDRAEIKDALAYARLALNPQDSAAFLRIINVPPRGLGASAVAALRSAAHELGVSLWQALDAQIASNTLPPRAKRAFEAFHALLRQLKDESTSLSLSAFFKSILDRSGLIKSLEVEDSVEAEGRRENLQELVNAALEAEARGETLQSFLDHAALVSDTDAYEERARATLMTLHTAKGLEFATVFLAGMEEGLFPHKLSQGDESAIEEERRLCYVGMTRAKRRLILTRALYRRLYGEDSFRGSRASRFLDEVPRTLMETIGAQPIPEKIRTTWHNSLDTVESVNRFMAQRAPWLERAVSERFRPPHSNARWKLGSQVRHAKYGVGTVIDCEGEGEDAKITISFPGHGRKKMIDRYAALERA
jgi:DNA helicase II / ATP-dependent DNA helicase PcrA